VMRVFGVLDLELEVVVKLGLVVGLILPLCSLFS
jgi:hypothetical protein